MSNHDLTQGPVSASLARLTAPMMVGVSSSILVQVLELGFIGQLSTAHVAAITFTFPLVMVLTSIALGISIGTSSVIARSVGNRPHIFRFRGKVTAKLSVKDNVRKTHLPAPSGSRFRLIGLSCVLQKEYPFKRRQLVFTSRIAVMTGMDIR